MTVRPARPGRPERAVLPVGGHECLAAATPRAGRVSGFEGRPVMPAGVDAVRTAGRELATALRDRRRAVVVPLTLGRDPALAPAAAQTAAWAARGGDPGDTLLAEPLGTTTHLVGWLREAVVRTVSGGGAGRAVLLVAPPGGPDDDAELFKVAWLVWRDLGVRRVEAAIAGDRAAVVDGVDRCRRLGAREVVLVPASLVPPPACEGVRAAGRLLGPAALAALVRRRAAEAERRWRLDGADGLAVAAHPHHHHGTEGEHHGPVGATTETNSKGAAVHGR